MRVRRVRKINLGCNPISRDSTWLFFEFLNLQFPQYPATELDMSRPEHQAPPEIVSPSIAGRCVSVLISCSTMGM
jgi:hypothetical protein